MLSMTDKPARSGRIESINVGRPRAVLYRGRTVMTSIWKSPVSTPVSVRGINIEGDDQADRSVHGGPDKAVYAYARDDLDWWGKQLATDLEAGAFGENLTIAGLPVSTAVAGERWRIGTALLEVAQPRLPCFKLGIRMSNARFPKRFGGAGRPGAYLRILEDGEMAAGDSVEVIHRPHHGVTMEMMSRARLHDHGHAARLLEAPEIPLSWHEWAREQQ
ncbi:MAG: MOSC domain-containing protein [Chloroflexota bacterium]